MRALAISAVVSALLAGPHAWAQSPFSKLEFLLGQWTGVTGEKDSQVGAGQGDFSFELQLNRTLIIRRNHSEYDSGERHDDLLVIYLDPPNATPRAIYFDGEGHVIRYNVAFPAPNSAVFESDGSQPGPRYRLIYRMEAGGLQGKFEIAPPGAAYSSYLSWKSVKR